MQINKVYRQDAADFLRQRIGDSSVDLAIVDPPYNLKMADWDCFASHADFLEFTFNWLGLLLPKLKETGSLYVFNTPFNAAHILRFLSGRGMVFQNWIVWDKRDGMSASKRKYANGQEAVLFFTKSEKHVFNYDNIRIPYESADRMKYAQKAGILKNGKRWYPNSKGKLCPEVWHFSSERHKRKINGKTQKMPHLTPKPLDMIMRMIKASSNEGDLVLDCFMGSGTTAVASVKLKRNFTGCENNQAYYRLCVKNITAAHSGND
ncbi:MAG: DNA-methyltransferase [Gammaproteobacteria bacterium]